MASTRYLTSKELQYIKDSLPEVIGSNSLSRSIATEQVKKNIIMDLRQYKFKDIPDLVDILLKDFLIPKWNQGIVVPGTAIGIHTAEGLGGPTTQLALDSFHHSGTEQGSVSGLDKITELIDTSKNSRKFQYTRTHFKDNFKSFEDILKMNKIFVETTVHDLVKSDDNNKEFYFSSFEESRNAYYDTYWEVMKALDPSYKVPNDLSTCLVLKLDPYKLYVNQITAYDVAANLESTDTVHCVAMPTWLGEIHVYPIINNITDGPHINALFGNSLQERQEEISIIFLKITFIPALKQIIVKGMKGNRSIVPIKVEIKKIIKYISNFRFDTQEDDQLMEIGIFVQYLLTFGLEWDRIINFLDFLGYSIVYSPIGFTSEDADRNIVKKVSKEIKNHPFPDSIIVVTHPEHSTIEQALEKLKDDPDFKMYTNYYYAQIEGTNFRDVLNHISVDPTRTISNNPYQVSEVLGIGAARKLLIEEYIDTFGSNNVNPRNILNIVNFQTSQGVYLPITSRSVARQPIGPAAKASFQESTQCFIKGAAFGAYENADSLSTSIYVGKRTNLGSGFSKIVYNDNSAPNYPQNFDKKIVNKVVNTDDAGPELYLGDEELGSSKINMPPNYPPPPMINCIRELPPFVMRFIRTDVYTQIRGLLYKDIGKFSATEFLKFDSIYNKKIVY